MSSKSIAEGVRVITAPPVLITCTLLLFWGLDLSVFADVVVFGKAGTAQSEKHSDRDGGIRAFAGYCLSRDGRHVKRESRMSEFWGVVCAQTQGVNDSCAETKTLNDSSNRVIVQGLRLDAFRDEK